MSFLHQTIDIKKTFPEVLMISFKNDNSSKDHLVESQQIDIDQIGRLKPCREKRYPCHLCKSMNDTCIFRNKSLDGEYKTNRNYN